MLKDLSEKTVYDNKLPRFVLNPERLPRRDSQRPDGYKQTSDGLIDGRLLDFTTYLFCQSYEVKNEN